METKALVVLAHFLQGKKQVLFQKIKAKENIDNNSVI